MKPRRLHRATSLSITVLRSNALAGCAWCSSESTPPPLCGSPVQVAALSVVADYFPPQRFSPPNVRLQLGMIKTLDESDGGVKVCCRTDWAISVKPNADTTT